MKRLTLSQMVAEHPFPDYKEWWDVGREFSIFMSDAIVSEWTLLPGNDGSLETVNQYVRRYLHTVFGRPARSSLLIDFINKNLTNRIQSGEFDAISYAFYRSAFEMIEANPALYVHALADERRGFTKRVGKRFFKSLHHHLHFDPPSTLDRQQDFEILRDSINRIGEFLRSQGYLRDHFDFSFDLDVEYGGSTIRQTESQFLTRLKSDGLAYALYEMGFPIILPSAVYLYQSLGEAQHHSSRIMEELFSLVGYQARETDDFDPTGFPPDRVIELWQIAS